MDNVKRVFWFHYNKPESRRQGRAVMTVHYKGGCIPVHNIQCSVPTWTHHRNSQPHCVIKGRGMVTLEEKDGEVTAVIN